ncbi:MAG: response regulator, partial [Myxococcales bacterium]
PQRHDRLEVVLVRQVDQDASEDRVVVDDQQHPVARLDLVPVVRHLHHHARHRVLLIIDDDPIFARILVDLAHENDFKAVVALRGDTGLTLARDLRPDAITLDLRLPVVDGWAILDRLKHDPRTRHIPVHVISAVEDGKQRGLRLGAIAYLQKPIERSALASALTNVRGFIERRVKNLLVVEDDDIQRGAIVALIGNGDVHSTPVGTAAEALDVLRREHFDCMVLDLGLPDMNGFTFIDKVKNELKLVDLPIIIYTGRDLTPDEETQLKRVTEAIIVKSARSPEHLLDETTLFLHRIEANLPENKRRMLQQVHQSDPVFANKRVLVVDDDVRNIFAITSVLERQGMKVSYAENGRKGIETLQSTPDIDVVLMDVMMPEMDGYETMREIRKLPPFAGLPIIALTAKAMKGDREKCIAAGASDYVTKPVDPDALLSLLRIWLYGQ